MRSGTTGMLFSAFGFGLPLHLNEYVLRMCYISADSEGWCMTWIGNVQSSSHKSVDLYTHLLYGLRKFGISHIEVASVLVIWKVQHGIFVYR